MLYIEFGGFVFWFWLFVVVVWGVGLVSSQNWSRTAVAQNREAGLVIRYPALARYYAGIFESDWKTALTKVPIPGKKTTIAPEVVAKGNFVEVRAADYEEV